MQIGGKTQLEITSVDHDNWSYNDFINRDLQNKYCVLRLSIKASQQEHPDMWNKMKGSQLVGTRKH